MTQVYKAQDEFEIDGVTVRRGEEIALSAREGEKLVKEGKLSVSTRELDLNEPKDVELGKAADKRKADKHEEIKENEAEREEAVADRETANDEVRKEKLGKMNELHQQKYGEPAPAHYEGMTDAEMDNTITDLEALEDFKAEESEDEEDSEEEETEEEEVKEDPKPVRKGRGK